MWKVVVFGLFILFFATGTDDLFAYLSRRFLSFIRPSRFRASVENSPQPDHS